MPSAFSIGSRLLNLDDLTPTVVSAVLADGVRQLGLPALGTCRVGRRGRLPVRAPVPGLGPGGLTLRDGQRLPPCSSGHPLGVTRTPPAQYPCAGQQGRPSVDR